MAAIGLTAHHEVAPMYSVAGQSSRLRSFYLKHLWRDKRLQEMSLKAAKKPNLAESSVKGIGSVPARPMVLSRYDRRSLTITAREGQLDDISSVGWKMLHPIHPDSCWMRL